MSKSKQFSDVFWWGQKETFGENVLTRVRYKSIVFQKNKNIRKNKYQLYDSAYIFLIKQTHHRKYQLLKDKSFLDFEVEILLFCNNYLGFLRYCKRIRFKTKNYTLIQITPWHLSIKWLQHRMLKDLLVEIKFKPSSLF